MDDEITRQRLVELLNSKDCEFTGHTFNDVLQPHGLALLFEFPNVPMKYDFCYILSRPVLPSIMWIPNNSPTYIEAPLHPLEIPGIDLNKYIGGEVVVNLDGEAYKMDGDSWIKV